MGKHLRANRKTPSTKPKTANRSNPANPSVETEHQVSESGDGKSVVVANLNLSSHNLDVNAFGKCTDEELEEMILTKLECLYREVIVTLVRLGHKEDVALKAVLKNGHCYGSMDPMSNVVYNALKYLNGGCESSNDEDEEEVNAEEESFSLRDLAEYWLAEMVCILQKIRPEMCKADALWCFLMGDVDLGSSSYPQVSKKAGNVEVSGEGGMYGEVGFPPGLCKFHGGTGSKVECPKTFDLPPPLKEMLSKIVAQHNSSKLSGGSLTADVEESGLKQDAIKSVLDKLCEMKLDDNIEKIDDGRKEKMITSLMQQIKDLEKQVEERREWAREKAMQAARKLSSDLSELKILRMEREEKTQHLKKGNRNVEDATKKTFEEMESTLRKASGQVDRANAAVRHLENENAELKAEIEAAKLSASENVNTCLEIAKREKKSVRRMLVLEKQKTKLQEEIAAEKKRIAELRQEIIQVEQAQKVTEAKCKREIEAKDQALPYLEELRQTKEAIEAENKRRHETLRLKIEIDLQRNKDDLQRLEQELARLKLSANPVSSPSTKNIDRNNAQEDTIARMLSELDLMDASSETEEYINRECILCMIDEVSVVFLPCAHQVICARCNETYGKKGKATCPCCRETIQQRICVFGASS